VATIRERKKAGGTRVFHAQVRMAGFPARTASFRTRRQAERWATMVEAEMIEGKHFRSVEARRRTLADAVDRYFRDELPKKRDARMHKTTLSFWKAQIGHLKLADVTPAVIAEHRDKLRHGTYTKAKKGAKRSVFKDGEKPTQYPRSPSTVNRYLSCLGHLFTVARREWHWIGWKPTDSVSKYPEGAGRVRHLSDDECQALLEQTSKDPTLHCFVLIALSTACRAGELVKLEWKDVDLKDGRVLFRQTKNAQPRTVWLYGTALDRLKAHAKVRKLKGGRVFESETGKGYDYNRPFREAVAAAGIMGFRFHDLRHTAATYLAQQGATEQQLRAIGGWKSGIVSRYVHLAANDAKAALEQLAERIGKPAPDE
jgi:integrase